ARGVRGTVLRGLWRLLQYSRAARVGMGCQHRIELERKGPEIATRLQGCGGGLRLRARILIPACVLGCLFGSAAYLAAQEPQITSPFPMGGRQGTTVSIEILGKNLRQTTSLWADSDLLRPSVPRMEEIDPAPGRGDPAEKTKATREYRVFAQLEIGSAAHTGFHVIRLVSPHGVSNPLAFLVAS